VDGVENLSTGIVENSKVSTTRSNLSAQFTFSIIFFLLAKFTGAWNAFIDTPGETGNKRAKNKNLSTHAVDNLVNKCVEVMKLYSNRERPVRKSHSYLRQQFIHTQ
jgi:hypothetical protein